MCSAIHVNRELTRSHASLGPADFVPRMVISAQPSPQYFTRVIIPSKFFGFLRIMNSNETQLIADGRSSAATSDRVPLLLGKPRLLDLFCCAGGAGVGYARAGFEVVGVDIVPQKHYPFAFIQADVLSLDPRFVASFDAIHASPPCQSYSDLAKRNGNADAWPRLVEPVREMLIASGRPYVIENVEGAPLINAVVLCGTMFPGLRVLRHRLFEANFEIPRPFHPKHPRVHTFDKRKSHYGKTNEWTDFVQVTGGGNCTLAAAKEAMGIDWMTKGEINESIPPAYTQYVGQELLRHISTTGTGDKTVRSRTATT
jgi:DNA (cytosine-5)-methyltransferase 1